jgi:SWI/SNF-related matrix-associated actin-dependent regulator 1 of chromatin subfamily A
MKIILDKSKYHKFGFYYNYNPQVVDFCRSLKDAFGWQNFGFEAEGDKKRWVFSQRQILEALVAMYPQIQIDPNVRIALGDQDTFVRKVEERAHAVEEIKNKEDTDFVPKGIKGELYPFQRVTVEFLNASGGRALISSQPGAGKTCMSLAFLTHNKIDRTLVVCPASVKSAWAKEIEKWTKLSYVIIDSKTKLKDIPASVNVWIVNYDILKKHLEELLKVRFDCSVMDEIHYCKSPKSLRSKAAIALSRKIPYLILLSGTPVLNRPSEAFTLLNMIDPKTWNNWYQYARDFCGGQMGRWGFEANGATNIPVLHDRIKRYFIRHKKEDVLKQLPPKVYVPIPVDLPPKYQEEYDQAEESLAVYLKTYKNKKNPEIARAMQAEALMRLNALRQILSKGKTEAAKEIIESVVESGEKILVFGSFLDPLHSLKDSLGDSAVMITGETPVKDRGDIVDKFQTDPSATVFIGGIRSANTGITLTAASACLFVDFSWVPADHEQAENRLHRPSQEASSVTIYQLYVPHTIDMKLKAMLDRKQRIVDGVIDGVQEDDGEEIVKEMLKDVTSRRKL